MVVILRSGILVAAVLLGACSRFASGTGEQAGKAERDALWAHVPPAMVEQSRFVGLADATWVPTLGERKRPATRVGRYYRTNVTHAVALAAWDRAAADAGWRPLRAACQVPPDADRRFFKVLGHWPSALTVSFDVAGYLAVVITVPEPELAVPQRPCPPNPGGFEPTTPPTGGGGGA